MSRELLRYLGECTVAIGVSQSPDRGDEFVVTIEFEDGDDETEGVALSMTAADALRFALDLGAAAGLAEFQTNQLRAARGGR